MCFVGFYCSTFICPSDDLFHISLFTGKTRLFEREQTILFQSENNTEKNTKINLKNIVIWLFYARILFIFFAVLFHKTVICYLVELK